MTILLILLENLIVSIFETQRRGLFHILVVKPTESRTHPKILRIVNVLIFSKCFIVSVTEVLKMKPLGILIQIRRRGQLTPLKPLHEGFEEKVVVKVEEIYPIIDKLYPEHI